MTSVELRRVSKVYTGTTAVLDQVDLTVDDGELLVLLGPNGSGKTTLLRLIAGLERVTAGEILLGGQVVNDWPPRQRNLAMVFQSGVLYPHLTVKQNLEFGARNSGGGLQDRILETAQLLGIQFLLNRVPRQLSGGERQRVALGRALVRQPAVFLLDEPLANADARLRQELRVVFQRARQRFPGTMILVSHDHTEALALGQRIAVLGLGRVQQIGSPGDVYARPKNRFVAEFMGRSAMRFVDGIWQQDQSEFFFVTKFGRLPVPRSVVPRSVAHGVMRDGSQVSLGMRSDAVAVSGSPTSATGTMATPDKSNWTGRVEWLERVEDGFVAHVALANLVAANLVAANLVAANLVAANKVTDELLLVARVSSLEAVSPGDRVRVEVDWERTFWFDKETGRNLALPH